MAALRTALVALVIAFGSWCGSATAGAPRILMTGDSMIDSLAANAKHKLERRLGEAKILHDGRPGDGISKSWRTNWVRHARAQMRHYRPRATVVMLGANDGFPMLDDRGLEVKCCRRAWIEAYARDVGRMMRTYAAHGRFLYWLTLPAPQDAGRRRICLAVDIALERAALRAPARARLLDMASLFTPDFRFRWKMRIGGRRVKVREPDAIHLNVNGAALAMRRVQREMRADGVLP